MPRGALLAAAAAFGAAVADASVAALAASPTCALNGTACPPPQWPAQWNLTMSTICQPGGPNAFQPPANEPWGLISLDWSVGENQWNQPNKNQSTCEATSISNCRAIKAASPQTRCFIYHNTELALQWLESQRAVMYSHPEYFLQYKNGTVYNEARGEGDQFFWNFTNPDAANYFIDSISAVVSSDPAVDGSFSDDVTGLPAEHGEAPAHLNMTAAEVAALQFATQSAVQVLIDKLVASGKYLWQAWGAQDGVGPGVSKGNCASFMAQRCTPAWQQTISATYSMDAGNAEQSIAGFLITRGPIAYIGYGWESDMRAWNPIFLTQVGEPQGLCYESSAGVFTREWTYGNVTLDCNTWTATIPHA